MPTQELLHAGAAERLDRALAAAAGVSRGAARRLIADGAIFLNGSRCKVASRMVRAGDRLRVGRADEPGDPAALVILHEGEGMIAVDKPAGMPTSPTRQGATGTALTVLGVQLERRDRRRPRLWVVHRLDTATSGVLLFATTRAAAAALSEAFRRRAVRKGYVALVAGAPAAEAGVVDQPLAAAGGRARLDPRGRPARTAWRVRERRGDRTLLDVDPQTGRLHQIRAHLAAIGLPVVGDRAYGGPPASRLMLHAESLEVAGRRIHAPLAMPDEVAEGPPAD